MKELYFFEELPNVTDDISELISIPFNQVEINKIEATLNSTSSRWRFISNIKYCSNNTYYLIIQLEYNFSYRNLYIRKYEDEWFIITGEGVLDYKCDQIDGVVNCLKYLLHR